KSAAGIGKQDKGKAGQRPAQGGSATPAAGTAPPEQPAKGNPRQQCEDGLVIKRYQLGRQAGGHDGTRDDRQGQDNEADAQQLKQQSFLDQQGGHGVEHPAEHGLAGGGGHGLVQVPVHGGHEDGVQG